MSAILVISVKIYTYYRYVLKHILRVRISKLDLFGKRMEDKVSGLHFMSFEMNTDKEYIVEYPVVLDFIIYVVCV